METQPPWASGPGEILKHGLELLIKDTDTNRRLAMISIDNAVELTIKTYLGLPKRVSGLSIARIEYQDFAESFPKLLDALEKHSSDKLEGIDLGEIEWYHRLRNQLYHQGNGLTVEKDKVEIYAELANILFANLFGIRLTEPEEDETVLLGKFMEAWVNFERTITEAVSSMNKENARRPYSPMRMIDMLVKEGIISQAEMNEINDIRRIRNETVHGVVNYKDIVKPETVEKLNSITAELLRRLESKGENP